jgi:hypothetical protein
MSLRLYVAVSHECDMIQVKIKYRLNLSVKTTSEFLKNTVWNSGGEPFTRSHTCTARDACVDSPRRVRAGREATQDGGASRDRTDDLLLAKQALSQLSYGP